METSSPMDVVAEQGEVFTVAEKIQQIEQAGYQREQSTTGD